MNGNIGPGVLAPVKAGRASQIVTTIIPANTSIPVSQGGNCFYLTLATASVKIKPYGQGENVFTQGTGLRAHELSPFSGLQVTNENAFNVVISIFVGWGDYIDNRAILFNPLVSNVVYGTSPVANAGAIISIPDLSGQQISSINGETFLALNRIAVYVSNLDLATVYYLNSDTVATDLVLAIEPQTSAVFPGGGNLKMNSAGLINGIVSEIYAAVRPGLT